MTALTEKCHRLTLDLELTKSHHSTLQERFSDLRHAHDAATQKLSEVTQSRDQLSATVADRVAEINRLARSNDLAMSELAELKSQRDKLSIQLEERERNFLALKEQNDRLVVAFEKRSEQARDRDDLNSHL